MENTYKSIDIVLPDSTIIPIGFKQLTLKEREKLFLKFEEEIKNRRRKEYLEISKLMDIKEKTKYLVECANQNKVSIDEIIEESQTINGITEIFKISANKQLDWSIILSDEKRILPVLKGLYYSLGVEIPDDLPESPENNKEPELKQGDFFQQN